MVRFCLHFMPRCDFGFLKSVFLIASKKQQNTFPPVMKNKFWCSALGDCLNAELTLLLNQMRVSVESNENVSTSEVFLVVIIQYDHAY